MDHLKKFMQSLSPAKSKGDIVTQHNLLIRAKYDYNYREIKVSRLITSKINPLKDYERGRGISVRITPAEAKAVLSNKGKSYNSVWRDFRDIVRSLNSKPIDIETDEIEGDVYWTSSCVRDKRTGEYIVDLTPTISPFLVALKGLAHTSVPLALYSHLKSKYHARLYEILYSYRSMRGGVIKYEDWKELASQTGWEGEKYSHFKNRVLLTAQQVFPTTTTLSFGFSEIKKTGSRAVAGIEFKVNVVNPVRENSPNMLIPELSDDYNQAMQEIRYQLSAWSVSQAIIEKLIADPFQFIKDEKLLKKVREKYTHKINYLWEKMEYVAQAKEVKDEAKYLMKAIQFNYVSKVQKAKKESADKKAFYNERDAKLAAIEREIAEIRGTAYQMTLDIVGRILDDNPELMEELFMQTARKQKRNKDSIGTLKMLFQSDRGMSFRASVINEVTKRHPEKFKQIKKSERETLEELNKKKIAVQSVVYKGN